MKNTDSSFKNNLGDSHQKDEITDASSSNVDDSIQKDDSAKPLAHGELENNFVELDTAIDILKSKENILDSVPPGPKENVYFLVSNKKNLERRNSRKKSEFFDDCGIWSSKSSSPTMHYVYYNDNYKKVYLRNDKCCIQKQVNKKQTYVPLEPQPSLDEVITVHRVYSNLKNDLSYKRRVTWISKGPTDLITCTQEKALYEYLGKYPGPSVHGKAKNSEREYARCPSHVLETIATKAKLSNPQNVYNDMVNNTMTEVNKPMDTKQIKNKKYYEKKKDQGSNEGYKRNFADNVIRVENMVHTHPFVQSVIHTKDKVPAVICYTPEQLLDIQRFCIKGNCVLGFDKTFNLGGDVHVSHLFLKICLLIVAKLGNLQYFLVQCYYMVVLPIHPIKLISVTLVMLFIQIILTKRTPLK